MHQSAQQLMAVYWNKRSGFSGISARPICALMLALAVWLALLPRIAFAGTIAVDGATCTLVEAIEAANSDTGTGNCPINGTVGGADTLNLAAGTHALTAVDNSTDGDNGTPSITSTVTIVGDVGGTTVARTGASDYRLFHVGGSGHLTLQNITLTNGRAYYGGGIYNRGVLTLTATTLDANTAAYYGGGLYNEYNSTATISASEFIANTAAYDGGGLYNNYSAATISNTSFLANTAAYDGGGLFNYSSTATISASDFSSNTAAYGGGGLFNDNNSTATISASDFSSNTAAYYGGGLYNNYYSTATISDTSFLSNTADYGGGLYNEYNSTTTISDSDFISNTAGYTGGGFYNYTGGTANISNSDFISNTALEGGAGIYNDNATINVSGSDFISNRAAGSGFAIGGGLASGNFSTATVTSSFFSANAAEIAGGGLLNFNNGVLNLSDSDFISNIAAMFGGGLASGNFSTATITSSLFSINMAVLGGGLANGGVATVSDSDFIANTAQEAGGGIANIITGTMVISTSAFISNTAAKDGGAIFQDGTLTATQVNESCIVNNSDRAVAQISGSPLDAANNWWGAVDGPGGVGPGSGDSVSSNVSYSPFKTSPILGCPAIAVDVTLSKTVAPLGNLLPGQPLTYTISVANNDTLAIADVLVSDSLPAAFQLTQVISSGVPITPEVGGFRLGKLNGGATATITLIGAVSPTLNSQTALINTATISHVQTGELSATVTSQVVVPLVGWTTANFEINEGAGPLNTVLVLNTPNPYAPVQVQVVSTDTLDSLSIAAVQNVTIAAGNISQTVPIAIADDSAILARTIALSLQNPQGAALGNNSSAIVVIHENDQAGLTVDKSANVSQAEAGDTITYSYHITNTGNISLTIAANDNRLGVVGGLAGVLAPLATRTATLNYTVQPGDPAGPLVNTVTVTGTDSLNTPVIAQDSFTVNISSPTSLPEEGQPTQQLEMWLPRIEH